MIEVDEGGAFLTLGLDRADAVREALTLAGIPFREDDPEGCTGPVYAVLRFDESTSHERIAGAISDALG